MPLKHDLFCIVFRQLDGVAAFRFDQNTQQAGGIEQHVCRDDRHDDQLIGVETHRFALPGHHADHTETPVTQPHPCADHRFLTEQLALDLGAQYAHRLAGMDITGGQELPLA